MAARLLGEETSGWGEFSGAFRKKFTLMKLLATLLAALLLVLTPLAHGSPIDPSSPGFWDNADFDDVILFLTSGLHLIHVDEGPVLGAPTPAAHPVVEGLVASLAHRALSPSIPRGPPAS